MSDKPTGTCPDCGRPGLTLMAGATLPRHKATGDPATWPTANAAGRNGYCKGGGRYIGDVGTDMRYGRNGF